MAEYLKVFICGVVDSERVFSGFGTLPNKQILPDKPQRADGQDYGTGANFLQKEL